MSEGKQMHTPGPWVIEARGGHELTGVEAEIAEMEDCEAYALRQLTIVAPSKPTGAKRRNKETGKFDIPVPATVCEITYDPRYPGNDSREADARLIAAAPEMFEALKAIVGQSNSFLSRHANEQVRLDTIEDIAIAALAAASTDGGQ